MTHSGGTGRAADRRSGEGLHAGVGVPPAEPRQRRGVRAATARPLRARPACARPARARPACARGAAAAPGRPGSCILDAFQALLPRGGRGPRRFGRGQTRRNAGSQAGEMGRRGLKCAPRRALSTRNHSKAPQRHPRFRTHHQRAPRLASRPCEAPSGSPPGGRPPSPRPHESPYTANEEPPSRRGGRRGSPRAAGRARAGAGARAADPPARPGPDEPGCAGAGRGACCSGTRAATGPPRGLRARAQGLRQRAAAGGGGASDVARVARSAATRTPRGKPLAPPPSASPSHSLPPPRVPAPRCPHSPIQPPTTPPGQASPTPTSCAT
jgi:hypothetical protein